MIKRSALLLLSYVSVSSLTYYRLLFDCKILILGPYSQLRTVSPVHEGCDAAVQPLLGENCDRRSDLIRVVVLVPEGKWLEQIGQICPY